MSDQWIDSWLGVARFQRYLDECAGDRAKALDLYEWNVEAGQALMHDIAHFEVALRNAVGDGDFLAACMYLLR